jgi:polyhydroxyalkanoate synthase subunit PhaE
MADVTNGSDGTNQLINAWAEVNFGAWQSWLDFMKAAMHHSTAQNKPIFEPASQGFINYQQLQIRLLKLSFQAWQELIPMLESGDWQPWLDRYTKQLRAQLQILASIGQVDGSKPWSELNHFYWDSIYQKMFEPWVHSPLLGPNRVLASKFMRSFDAWAHLQPASVDYQLVLTEIQVQAFETLMRTLLSLAEKGETVREWSQFQKLWSQTADRVFEQAFCREDNLKIRGKFLNAINQYKLCQQELIETYMQMMNMPTRREVDEIHKNIYDLRKEVRNLKQTLARYETHNLQAEDHPFKEV